MSYVRCIHSRVCLNFPQATLGVRMKVRGVAARVSNFPKSTSLNFERISFLIALPTAVYSSCFAIKV